MKFHWPDPSTLNVSPHQRAELAKAFVAPICILTGTPGTGKTRTAGEVIKAMAQSLGTWRVAVCAPTGKAAQRINQSLQANGCPANATTIHRLLGVARGGHDGKGWGFVHGPNMPLPHKLIAIDEASMLGTDLGYSLFSAVEPGTHILLIGDENQLPPIEHGAPLRDLIAAGIPVGRLSEIWRNEGLIVKACQDIKEGRSFRSAPRIQESAGWNLMHIESHKAAVTIETLKGLLGSVPAELDKIWDVQVIVAVNAKSELSRKSINLILQELLNPGGKAAGATVPTKFRVGDKVICTSNSMLELVEETGNRGEGLDVGMIQDGRDQRNGTTHQNETYPPGRTDDFVANGEIGKIVRFQDKTMHVEFADPRRTVKVPLGKPKKEKESGKNNSKTEDSDDSESVDTGCNFDLGYALTYHRCQGSQWPVAILLIDDYGGAGMIASRELVYTGCSRAERICLTIGRKATIDKWCRKQSLPLRKTFLVEQLKGAF